MIRHDEAGYLSYGGICSVQIKSWGMAACAVWEDGCGTTGIACMMGQSMFGICRIAGGTSSKRERAAGRTPWMG